jgi:hypothetical protein
MDTGIHADSLPEGVSHGTRTPSGLTSYLERYEEAVVRGLITEGEMHQLAKLDIVYDRAGIT